MIRELFDCVCVGVGYLQFYLNSEVSEQDALDFVASLLPGYISLSAAKLTKIGNIAVVYGPLTACLIDGIGKNRCVDIEARDMPAREVHDKIGRAHV